MKFAAPHMRGGDSFQSFSRFLLRLASITVDLPYEILAGDYTGLNYTTLRVGRNDFMQQIAPVQSRHVLRFCAPVMRRVLDWAVITGRVALPGYWKNPWHYRRGVFIPPGMRPVDPLREMKAAIEGINSGLRSPQEVILERGGDPETVLDEAAEWKEMCAERDLDFSPSAADTSLANNPAAVAGEEMDGEHE